MNINFLPFLIVKIFKIVVYFFLSIFLYCCIIFGMKESHFLCVWDILWFPFQYPFWWKNYLEACFLISNLRSLGPSFYYLLDCGQRTWLIIINFTLWPCSWWGFLRSLVHERNMYSLLGDARFYTPPLLKSVDGIILVLVLLLLIRANSERRFWNSHNSYTGIRTYVIYTYVCACVYTHTRGCTHTTAGCSPTNIETTRCKWDHHSLNPVCSSSFLSLSVQQRSNADSTTLFIGLMWGSG